MCLCVESIDIARWFRQYTGSSMNALIDRENLPNFHVQLGCSGFVIIDEDGKFITTKSKAFLDYGDMAFNDVEVLLRENTSAFPGGNNISNGQLFLPSIQNNSSETITTSLPKVGHEDMDEEHEEIIRYLKALAQEKSKTALKSLLLEFRAHSEHEEQLMFKLGFGSRKEELSPLRSHADDHGRIIRLMDLVLSQSVIASSDVVKIDQAIHLHAERFDTLYAEVLNQNDCTVS